MCYSGYFSTVSKMSCDSTEPYVKLSLKDICVYFITYYKPNIEKETKICFPRISKNTQINKYDKIIHKIDDFDVYLPFATNN